MADKNHTPLDVHLLQNPSGQAPHYESLARQPWLRIQWDIYSIILFTTGIIFIISLLLWAYIQLTAA